MISFFLVEIKLNPPRTPTAVRATSAEIMTIAERTKKKKKNNKKEKEKEKEEEEEEVKKDFQIKITS
jgi:ribosomal protein L12E/L44/L45/RPP1/RPP2